MRTKKYEAAVKNMSCRVCGVRIADHPHCEGCGALIGPQHIEIESYWLEDQSFCKVCFEARGGILCEPRIE